VLQAKELNLQKQQELAFKRIAAIQQVLEGARPLLKALKLERKARVRHTRTILTQLQLLHFCFT